MPSNNFEDKYKDLRDYLLNDPDIRDDIKADVEGWILREAVNKEYPEWLKSLQDPSIREWKLMVANEFKDLIFKNRVGQLSEEIENLGGQVSNYLEGKKKGKLSDEYGWYSFWMYLSDLTNHFEDLSKLDKFNIDNAKDVCDIRLLDSNDLAIYYDVWGNQCIYAGKSMSFNDKMKLLDRLKFELEILLGEKKTDNIKEAIERAKQYPINKLIEFQHNFACCINHKEKTPSMKYYPDTNTVFCFGCEWTGDAIAVQQKLRNITFRQAILSLQH